MKKFAPIAVVVLLAVAFTSCKKDYTCTCTYDVGGTAITQSYALGKQKKKDAESTCTNHENNVKNLGTNASCKL